jgi:hypothetical protein
MAGMSARTRLAICLAVVCAIYAFHVHLKTAKIFANPTWDARDETGQFWSEFAFHYRFAKFFAEHPVRDWGQLARDRHVQFPDTVNDWAEFSIAMEVPVGVLYRWIYGNPITTLEGSTPEGLWSGFAARHKPAFHVFVVWYDCLVSSLTLFAVFFLARALWRSDFAGLMASAFYATLYPSYGRTVKNLFLREDFAIPLIVFALFFTVRMLQQSNRHDQMFAALFWVAALASWHLTQFVLAVVVAAAVLVYLGWGETPRRPLAVGLLALCSMLLPVLRAKQFYLSPTMCVLYALTLAVWINGGRRKAIGVFAASAASFLVLGALLQRGDYAHVYELFFCKLRFLGVKPANPSSLPWDARVLWESAFDTASVAEFWHSLAWCLPMALIVAAIGRQERRVATNLSLLFVLLLFPLSWMVVRYFTFLGFAAAVAAGGIVALPSIWWKPIALAAVGWQFLGLNAQPLDRAPVLPAAYRDVVKWVNENTPADAVLLASISESPVILAGTERPIVLHSKFENRTIRERYRQFLTTIYASEEDFARFARRYGADYFLFDRENFLRPGIESRRYKADWLGPLDPNCAVMRLAAGQTTFFTHVTNTGPFEIFRLTQRDAVK